MVLNSSHISRGNMFFRNGRLMSDSTISSSESLGWRGKDVVEDLQVLMAQVTKLRVRSFISAVACMVIYGYRCWWVKKLVDAGC
jgi:hypothetical protein